MKMNFDDLTKEVPVYLIPDGVYRAKIATAGRKKGTEADYISLRLDIFNDEGKRIAGIFDNIFEVPKKTDDMPQDKKDKIDRMSNKLRNFLVASEIPIPKSFDLKDILDNLSQAKEFKVQVGTRRQEDRRPQNIVNINQGGYFSLTANVTEERPEEINTADAF